MTLNCVLPSPNCYLSLQNSMSNTLNNILIRAESIAKSNWLHAVNILEHAAEEFPDDPRSLISMGGIYTQKRRYEKAIACYQKALSLKPDDDSLLYVIGNCYFAINEYRMALAYYKQITDQNPEVMFNKALVLSYIGESQESIDIIIRLINMINDNPFIYFLLVEQLIRLNKFDEALRYLQKGEAKIGKHKHLLLLKAVIFTKQEYWLKAYVTFTEYEEQTTINNEDHLHAYAVCARNIGKFSKAVTLLQAAITLNPYYHTLYEELVRIYIQIDDFSMARQTIDNARTAMTQLSPVLLMLNNRISDELHANPDLD